MTQFHKLSVYGSKREDFNPGEVRRLFPSPSSGLALQQRLQRAPGCRQEKADALQVAIDLQARAELSKAFLHELRSRLDSQKKSEAALRGAPSPPPTHPDVGLAPCLADAPVPEVYSAGCFPLGHRMQRKSAPSLDAPDTPLQENTGPGGGGFMSMRK